MPRSLLVAAYVAWPAAVVALRLITRVHRRCLVVIGAGCLISLVVGTTATPTHIGIPLGLLLGAGIGLGICLATARGVTFMYAPDATYWEYNGKIPTGDRLAELVTAVVAVVGGVGVVYA